MEKELLEQILKEIGALATKISAIDNKVDLLIEENRAEHQQLIGLIASQEQDLEGLSNDVRYLVKREADNRHNMMLLNKKFARGL